MKTSDITTKIVLSAYNEYWKNQDLGNEATPPIEFIMKATGCPEKLAYCAAERELNKDLIDFGVSIRWAWLNDKGKELLKTL